MAVKKTVDRALEVGELIRQLERVAAKHGLRLPVYYADGRDNACEVFALEVARDMGWEGEPQGLYIALS